MEASPGLWLGPASSTGAGTLQAAPVPRSGNASLFVTVQTQSILRSGVLRLLRVSDQNTATPETNAFAEKQLITNQHKICYSAKLFV